MGSTGLAPQADPQHTLTSGPDEGLSIDPEKPPNPLSDMKKKLASYASFWNTRKAVLRGEPVYDYSEEQLKSKHLLGPWTFNATQSAISALIAGFLGKAIAFFYPPADKPTPALDASASTFEKMTTYAGPVYDKLFLWFSTASAPFTLLAVATIIGWASLYKADMSKERRLRASNAYLYLDGTYGFYSQMLLALATAALVSDLNAAKVGNTAPTFILIASGSVLLVALIWQIYLTNYSLARKLFVINGYSPHRRTLFNFRKKLENPGPWELYKNVAIGGVGLGYWVLVGILMLLSYGIALGVARVKIALG